MPTDSDERGELTGRALAVGCALGGAIAAGNVYMGLQTGWNFTGNVTASMVGFVLLRAWSSVRRKSGAASPLETNTLQTAATSAAIAGFTVGLGGPLPGLQLAGVRFATWSLFAWGLLLGALGLALATQVRNAMVTNDALSFPSSRVTAEIITTVHRVARTGVRRARVLAAAAGLAGAVTWFRDGRPALIGATLFAPFVGARAHALSLGLGVSPMMLGVGVFLGRAAAVNVLAGAVVGYIVSPPWLMRAHAIATADWPTVSAWLMWPSAALMIGAALTSVLLDWRVFARAWSAGGAARSGAMPLAAALALPAAVGILAVAWVAFAVHPLVTLASIIVAALMAQVSARAAGETDVNPVGNMGLFAQAAAGSATVGGVPSAIAGSVTLGVANHMVTGIWSFKTGQLLGANPRRQLVAQLVGLVAGVAVAVPVYLVVTHAYALGSARLPAPGALPWRALTETLTHGGGALPPHAAGATLAALAAGAALTILGRTRLRAWAPMPVAIGIGMIIPFSFSAAIFVGGVAGAEWLRRSQRHADEYLSVTAAGLIAGETLVGVAIATLVIAGILPNP